jgi:hypothetical protein
MAKQKRTLLRISGRVSKREADEFSVWPCEPKLQPDDELIELRDDDESEPLSPDEMPLSMTFVLQEDFRETEVKQRYRPPRCTKCGSKTRVQTGPGGERFRRVKCTNQECARIVKVTIAR